MDFAPGYKRFPISDYKEANRWSVKYRGQFKVQRFTSPETLGQLLQVIVKVPEVDDFSDFEGSEIC